MMNKMTNIECPNFRDFCDDIYLAFKKCRNYTSVLVWFTNMIH